MRTLLFTGKGGVGKSTVAAGTAALAAAAGHRTLVLSTDAAHSLADAFDAPVGPEPTEVAANLFVQQVDAQLRFEQSWSEIQRYLLSVLDVAGVDPVAAEELTVIPGAEEVLALLELRLQARSGRWDVIVVDCAPTAETLRLLALPEALGWYMQRVLPVERRVVNTLRPVLTRAVGVPMPEDTVFDAVERLHAELDEVRALLSGAEASVRLVLTPEGVVLAEARRSYTTLSLYGYRVDGVVANRVFPAEGADDWRAGWVVSQDLVLEQVGESFTGLPVWRSVYRSAEPVGIPALTALAEELYDGSDPLALPSGEGPFRIRRTERGAVLHLALPNVSRAEVDLARHGDELVVTLRDASHLGSSGRAVGTSYRRLLTLPAVLAKYATAGARVEQGELQVRFEGEERVNETPGDAIGSVGEEAAKLFGVLSQWARDVSDHVDTGAAECSYCPVCRTVHVIRQASPEVRDHLAVAATSLMHAAAGVLAATAGGHGSERPGGVEHIDLDNDSDEWPEENR